MIKVRFPKTGSDRMHGLQLNCTFELINYDGWKCVVGKPIQYAVSTYSEPCCQLDIIKKNIASNLAGDDGVRA